MDNVLTTAEIWIDKLRLTTNLILHLANDTKLPNGWGKRELLIHLTGWDEEFINFSEKMRQQVMFYEFYEDKGEEKNQQFLRDNEHLDLDSALLKFKKLREKLISVYEEILIDYPQDNEEFLGFFSIWWHDLHHLKQTGIDVSKLEN